MESEPLLCQAEILYSTLSELVASEDRRQSYMDALKSDSTVRQRKGEQADGSEGHASDTTVVDNTVRELLQ